MDGDHPDSLEVILNVIHFRGQRSIPTVVSSEGLFKIGIIAHKYELGSAVRSWAYRWLRQIAWKDKIQDAVRWMALSWVLRDEGTFQHMTRFLIRNGKYLVTDGGERVLVDAEGNRMAVEGAPWVVIGMLIFPFFFLFFFPLQLSFFLDASIFYLSPPLFIKA